MSPNERFTYYDQSHTTGMDIQQTPKCVAAITLGKDMVLRDFAQGAWRMRQLGMGQSLEVLVPPQVVKLIQETSATNRLHCDALAWLCQRTITCEATEERQLRKLQTQTVARQPCLKETISLALTAKASFNPDASHCLSFLEVPVEFAILPTDAKVKVTLNDFLADHSFARWITTGLQHSKLQDIERSRSSSSSCAADKPRDATAHQLDGEVQNEKEAQAQAHALHDPPQKELATFLFDAETDKPWHLQNLSDAQTDAPSFGFPLCDFEWPDRVRAKLHVDSRIMLSHNFTPRIVASQQFGEQRTETLGNKFHPRLKNVTTVLVSNGKRPYVMALSLREAETIRWYQHKRPELFSYPEMPPFSVMHVTGARLVQSREFQESAYCKTARAVLRFFNSDVVFSPDEQQMLAKALSQTSVQDRIYFFMDCKNMRKRPYEREMDALEVVFSPSASSTTSGESEKTREATDGTQIMHAESLECADADSLRHSTLAELSQRCDMHVACLAHVAQQFDALESRMLQLTSLSTVHG